MYLVYIKIMILKKKYVIKQSGSGNLIWVFNYNKKKIVRITKDIYNEDRDSYYVPEEKTLYELAKLNTENIIKEIKENGENKYYNVGLEPIEYVQDDFFNKGSWLGSNLYHNPYGLWIGCGADWQNYINTPSQWAFSTHLYEINVSNSVKKISSIEELEDFISKYKNPDSDLKITNVLNWDKIKNEFDGLIICPYLGNDIWGENANQMALEGEPNSIQKYVEKLAGDSWKSNIFFTAEWYRHWETGSGVIWRASGIKDFKLVKRLSTFDDIDIEEFEFNIVE